MEGESEASAAAYPWARADVTGVGPVCLPCKTGLHLVKIRIVCAVLDPEDHERVRDGLNDRRARPLLKRDIYSCTGYERQAARLDEVHAVVFFLDFRLMVVVLEVLRETGI